MGKASGVEADCILYGNLRTGGANIARRSGGLHN